MGKQAVTAEKGQDTTKREIRNLGDILVRFADREDYDSKSKEELREFLQEKGFTSEPNAPDEHKGENLKRERNANFHNIQVFLEHFRRQEIALEQAKIDFATEILGKDVSAEELDTREFFEALSEELDIMSVTEAKKLDRKYIPLIKRYVRIEKAHKAMNSALSALKRENEELYNLIYGKYIECIPARDLVEKYGLTGLNALYRKLKRATEILQYYIFGNEVITEDERDDLIDIYIEIGMRLMETEVVK